MESEPRVTPENAREFSAPVPPTYRRRGRAPLPRWVNLWCFLLTVVTTLIAGAILTLDDFSGETMLDIALTPSLWSLGLPYSLSLIAILGAHEMGHYVACRIYGIEATLPFFIPGPPLVGTFGAVIRIRSPFMTRRALFDVGVAGPIAGFVVALPILAYGLSQSRVSLQPSQLGLPSCLLLDFGLRTFFPDVQAVDHISLHPTVGAVWVGLLATFLNLIPIGQLDGGHMLYALSRRAHRRVSLLAMTLLIACGMVFAAYHLIVFGVLWAVIGPGHPPVADESEPLGSARVWVAVAALVIFVLCFIPGSPRLY